MQQYSSSLSALAASLKAGASGAPGLNAGSTPHPINPISGLFGSGRVLFFTTSKDFVVPPNCVRVRARGFSPGGKINAPGGTLSFGTHFSITGGGAGTNTAPGAGGVATGGDINHSGAPGLSDEGFFSRAGGGGSLFGPGDRGGGGSSGRAGFTGKAGKEIGFNGSAPPKTEDGDIGRTDSIDFINTGGGGSRSAGGSGSGYALPPGNGGNGGAGGTPGQILDGHTGGRGGFPGGGDAGLYANQETIRRYPCGGGGFSMKDIVGLASGSVVPMTIPDGGLMIVEY